MIGAMAGLSTGSGRAVAGSDQPARRETRADSAAFQQAADRA